MLSLKLHLHLQTVVTLFPTLSPSFVCLQDDQTHGEIVLDLEGGKIFSVAQHQNNPNLNFLCVESKQVELYHKGGNLIDQL